MEMSPWTVSGDCSYLKIGMPPNVPQTEPESRTLPLIPEYFAGREVFITGATGFVGKVLVERLLWTCPEISKLHLLMRPKKKVDPEERLEQLKQCPVFDVIRARSPERLLKLSTVAGDVTKHLLHVDGDVMQQLSKVSVVIHSAATTKFNEPLREALQQNVDSVVNIMDVCDLLPNVQVFVYVSTAYSNSELSKIEERVYPAPVSLQILHSLVETLPPHKVADITAKLVSPKPNTYTFTKSIAESIVADRARTSNYATAIFRPAIVSSSLKQPFPGWIDNLTGVNAIVVAVGRGLLRVAPIIDNMRADMVPVDMVIDTLIAIVWELGIEDSRTLRIYNCSSYENPITWGEFRCRSVYWMQRYPFDTVLWYPFFYVTTNTFILNTTAWILETVPLHMLSFLYTMFGIKQSPKLSTLSRRIQSAGDTFKYFTTRQWEVSTNNVKRLRGRLAPTDAAIYNIDPKTIDWKSHSVDYVKGLRKYLLRESDKNLKKAKSKIWLLYIIHRTMQCLLLYVVFKLLPSIQWIANIKKLIYHHFLKRYAKYLS